MVRTLPFHPLVVCWSSECRSVNSRNSSKQGSCSILHAWWPSTLQLDALLRRRSDVNMQREDQLGHHVSGIVRDRLLQKMGVYVPDLQSILPITSLASHSSNLLEARTFTCHLFVDLEFS